MAIPAGRFADPPEAYGAPSSWLVPLLVGLALGSAFGALFVMVRRPRVQQLPPPPY